MMLSNGQVFVFVSSILGSALSDFISPPPDIDVYARQHRTIEIPWKFEGEGKILSVKWSYMKLDSSGLWPNIYTIRSSGKPASEIPRTQFTDRLEFRGDTSKKDFTLAIKNFVKDDEGIFTCQLNSFNQFILPVTIKATVLSNVTEFKRIGSNSGEILQGDNVTLSCTTTMGLPSPFVEIRRGNTVKNSTRASNTSETSILYHFDQISKDDEGSYSCRVTTQEFKSEKSFQLDVKYPPEIISSVPPEQFGCRGKLMMIDCSASGDPEPVVIIIGPDGKSLPKNEFVLEEFGTYRCEASSKLGSDSLNITVNPAKDKPEEPNFLEECSFTKLTWKASSDKSVKYTLQVREEGSKDPWGDIITSIDTRYSPSTNTSFSKKKDYEFRVIAKNCVGSTENERCIVKGETASPDESERSSSNNAGVIAGSVIAVLVVILIIVIAAVYCRRKKKRESPTVRLSKKSPPKAGSEIKAKPGGLLYSDSPNMDAPRVRPPVEYRQDEDDDGYEYASDTAASLNVPSWV